MGEFTIAEISKHIGRELGVSNWVTIDQSRINDFAHCTGDHQWIHVDVERAKRESPFRGPIAHGYLMLSMVAPLSMEVGILPKDSAAGLNYGIDKVRFLAPVPAGGPGAAARRTYRGRAAGGRAGDHEDAKYP